MSVTTQIIEKISAAPVIIIHRHENPDPDALGSQVGLAEIIRQSFPDKEVYQVGGSVGRLDWLAQMQTIDDAKYQDALVIVTDTANTPRVSDSRFDQGAYLIKIDHHPNDDQYGDLMWVKPDASSCSEIIVDLVNDSEGQLKLNDEAARLLYTGIIGDTGRFMYPSSTAHTLQVAAQLRGYQFSATDCAQTLGQITFKQAQLESWVYNHLVIDDNGAAYVTIKQSLLATMGIDNEATNSVVGTPGRLKEVVSWIIFVEKPEGGFRARIRSKGPVINELAKAHDGGGHPLASGANAQDEAEIKVIYGQLSELVARHQGK